MSAFRAGLLRCALAAVLFGATTPAAAQLARDTSAPVLAGLLYLGAGASAAPQLVARRLPRPPRRALRPLATAVVAGGLVGPLLLAAGLARTPGATASLLLNVELVATAVLAAALFHEHLGRRVVTGTLLVLAAGLVLTWSGSPDLRVGALLIIGACVCWGVDNCVTATLDEVGPETITFAKGAIAGTTNLLVGLAVGEGLPDGPATVGALALGAVGYGASITLWVTGARDLGAARGQLVFSLAPFIGVAVAWTVFGESVRGAEVVAVLVAGLGVARVLGSDHEHPHAHARMEHDHEHVHDDAHHDHTHPVAVPAGMRHSHRHVHDAVVHAHPHVPDLHHRHGHDA